MLNKQEALTTAEVLKIQKDWQNYHNGVISDDQLILDVQKAWSRKGDPLSTAEIDFALQMRSSFTEAIIAQNSLGAKETLIVSEAFTIFIERGDYPFLAYLAAQPNIISALNKYGGFGTQLAKLIEIAQIIGEENLAQLEINDWDIDPTNEHSGEMQWLVEEVNKDTLREYLKEWVKAAENEYANSPHEVYAKRLANLVYNEALKRKQVSTTNSRPSGLEMGFGPDDIRPVSGGAPDHEDVQQQNEHQQQVGTPALGEPNESRSEVTANESAASAKQTDKIQPDVQQISKEPVEIKVEGNSAPNINDNYTDRVGGPLNLPAPQDMAERLTFILRSIEDLNLLSQIKQLARAQTALSERKEKSLAYLGQLKKDGLLFVDEALLDRISDGSLYDETILEDPDQIAVINEAFKYASSAKRSFDNYLSMREKYKQEQSVINAVIESKRLLLEQTLNTLDAENNPATLKLVLIDVDGQEAAYVRGQAEVEIPVDSLLGKISNAELAGFLAHEAIVHSRQDNALIRLLLKRLRNTNGAIGVTLNSIEEKQAVHRAYWEMFPAEEPSMNFVSSVIDFYTDRPLTQSETEHAELMEQSYKDHRDKFVEMAERKYTYDVTKVAMQVLQREGCRSFFEGLGPAHSQERKDTIAYVFDPAIVGQHAEELTRLGLIFINEDLEVSGWNDSVEESTRSLLVKIIKAKQFKLAPYINADHDAYMNRPHEREAWDFQRRVELSAAKITETNPEIANIDDDASYDDGYHSQDQQQQQMGPIESSSEPDFSDLTASDPLPKSESEIDEWMEAIDDKYSMSGEAEGDYLGSVSKFLIGDQLEKLVGNLHDLHWPDQQDGIALYQAWQTATELIPEGPLALPPYFAVQLGGDFSDILSLVEQSFENREQMHEILKDRPHLITDYNSYMDSIPARQKAGDLFSTFEEIVRRRENALNASIAKFMHQMGLPAPLIKLDRDCKTPGSVDGVYHTAQGVLELNGTLVLQGDKPSINLINLIAHELTHYEQDVLIIRHLADELNIGVDPDETDSAKVWEEYQKTFLLDRSERFFAEVLKQREGHKLSEGEGYTRQSID